MPGLAGRVQRNNHIGTIRTWGPQYWVTLQLIVHTPRQGWTTLLAFRAEQSEHNYGQRTPLVNLHKRGARHVLHFGNTVNKNPDHTFDYQVQLSRWYTVVIQEISMNGKVKRGEITKSETFHQVYFIIEIDGREVHKIENRNATKTFRDVQVYAGDSHIIAAEASYKNLFWENLSETYL